MSSPYINVHSTKTPNVEFSAPIIGPKVYVAKGPSGWPETFNREQADRQLREFAGSVDLDELIETFVLQRTLAEQPEPTSWAHITHYLARVLNVPLKLIPAAVGVAFWACVTTVLIAGDTASAVN